MPTAPQYGRFYKALTQSGAPSGSPTEGTLMYDYTNSVFYVAHAGSWVDLGGQNPILGTVKIATALSPSTAGGINTGTAALPWAGIYLGSAATTNIRLTGTFTGLGTITIPDPVANSWTVALLERVNTWTATNNFAAVTCTFLSPSYTLASNAPSVTRLLRSELTLNTASGNTITPSPATDSFAAIRGAATLTSGKTLAAGFLYGVQGKVTATGATIAIGSNHLAGVYAQLDLGGTATITNGHVAGLIVSGQNWPQSAYLDGIYVESGVYGSVGTFNSLLKCVFDGAVVFDLSEQNSTGTMINTSATLSTGAGWIKCKIAGQTRYIPLYSSQELR